MRAAWWVILMVTASVIWFQSVPQLAGADLPKDERTRSDLAKLQGLWQTSPGGMEHRGGQQVVRNPVLDGPCFFVCGQRLIWLDPQGIPTGQEDTITLDVQAEPKRITLTPAGDGAGKKPSHGIYLATDTSLIVHLGLDGGPAPQQFLELNKPVMGRDGEEWLVSRKKLYGDD
jgi:uncharacterized protein (TIGR03067 family)